MKRNPEQTSSYIIDKVAPVFNKKGYVGTSLSDLNQVTQLTKGAIYCNFNNKEDLALNAFRYNVKKILGPLQNAIESEKSSIGKLLAMTAFYRNYYRVSIVNGGCPILNVGIDAKYNNPELFKAAKEESLKLLKGLNLIISRGIRNGEIKEDVDPRVYAQNIYSMIEGSVFMAATHENNEYMNNMLDHVKDLILNKLKK
jgi:TetR/AcrR family transcriptional regulator, transcriptional repressor for nem operon